jgi:ribosomal protein S18 acetylase RimI-like enzyme
MRDPATASTMTARTATAADLPAMADTMATAFHDDPVWGPWAFPDPERRPAQHLVFWGFFLNSALRYGWVHATPRCESVTLWLPPGGSELSPEDEERAPELIVELLGDRARPVMDGMRLFDQNHPHDEPHYYLSLWGTHADHRGRGIGTVLLRQDLLRIDDDHMPCYLESTNPANLDRYRSIGFVPRGSFELPGDGPTVTTMWRPAR